MPNAVVWTSYPQDMVFYYLTPARFRRYSSSNLCPALPSLGRFRIQRTGGGIWLVNPADESCLSKVRSAARRAGHGQPSAASQKKSTLTARLEAVPSRDSIHSLEAVPSDDSTRSESARSASCSN